MYTTLILLVFIAFLLFYNTSKKNNWSDKPAWARYLEARTSLSGSIIVLLLIFAYALLDYLGGPVAGIFSLIVIIMAMGSLIVLLFPFRYLSVKHILSIYLVFIVFELLIF
ncbi:hypothetical protein [Pedobacter hartonius]|uniref:Uncharacterized protein n=1 Tax=Pedobacter hartonius TaxID=425514 RepID=A0A1H4BJV5_9SPHI|nr:hypothetical protein [Pedobacter hartonius]SEA48475.1 hypothetical protein SAMN05443550_103379 [Pedobacter hartonius]